MWLYWYFSLWNLKLSTSCFSLVFLNKQRFNQSLQSHVLQYILFTRSIYSNPHVLICFDFKIKANYYKGLGEIKTKRNDVEEKKQILSENSIWNFVISHAIPKWFSSIKVGLCIFLNLNSFKTKENNLKIHLYGLIFTQLHFK